MRLKFTIILLSTLLARSLFAQQAPKIDSILYLFFDENEHLKIPDINAVDPITHDIQPESFYALRGKFHLYDGHPLKFISIRKEKSDTIAIKDLRQYHIITPEELKEHIVKNYKKGYVGYDGSDYFDRLKHIYLVEKDEEKGVASITEVRLDINIE